MKKTLLVSLTFGLLLSGCNDEDSLGTSEGTGVRFTSYMVESRASDTGWDAGDEIGVYMQADAASGYKKINVKYANSNGDVNTFTSETPIVYSGNESTVNFMAVYPFSSLVTDGTYEFTLGNTSLSQNDIMYASTTSVAAGTQNVKLNFQHKLTKIVLQLNDEDGNPVTGATISINKQRASGTLDVATGTITATGDYTSTLNFSESNGGYEAIVIPDEGREGRSVLIEANGRTYSYPVGDIEFSEATKYTFPVSLRPAEPGEEEEGGGTIIKLDAVEFSIGDWTEGKTIGWIISTDAVISTEDKVETKLETNLSLNVNSSETIAPKSDMTLETTDVYSIEYTRTDADLTAATLIITQPNTAGSRAAQQTYTLPAGLANGRLLFAVGEFTNGFSVSSTVALTLDTVSVYSESVPEEDEPETPSDTEKEVTVWEGSQNLGNWNGTSIDYSNADILAKTTVGSTLRFYYTDKTEGAQLQFAGGATIDVTDNTGYVDMEVTAEIINAITENGNWPYLNGQNMTVTRIALIPASGSGSDNPGGETPSQTEEIEVWTGSHNLGNWSGTNIPFTEDILAKTTEGCTLRFYYTDWTEGAQLQFAIDGHIDVTDDIGYVDMEVTTEVITALTENNNPWMNGQNMTITRIALIPASGSGSDNPGGETPSQTEEIEVWTGSHNLGNWSGTNIPFTEDILAKTTEGCTLRFYYTDWTEGAQLQFAIDGHIDVTDDIGYVDMEVTTEVITALTENNNPWMNGQNMTITRIVLICPAE